MKQSIEGLALDAGVAKARTFARRARAFLGKGWVVEKTRLVVEDNGDLCTRPIFIVGAHRSGTSLVRRVLDSHPAIACPPESFFLKHFTPLLADVFTFAGLENLGFDRAAALAGLRRGASHFHEAYRRAKGKPRWADKTPQYAFHLDTLETLFGPDCQYVLVLRHPLDVAYSLFSRRWGLDWPGRDEHGEPLQEACRYVAESVRQQLAFQETHVERCHVVRYEALVHSPEPTLRALCAFLDEPWDPVLLRHHDRPHDLGTEDPIARGTPGFRPSEGNYRAWPPADVERAWTLLEPIASRAGYGRDG